jgi:hypothetical protein
LIKKYKDENFFYPHQINWMLMLQQH